MQTFNFPYHVQNTEYPESGTRVQLGNGYIFTSPPNGPDLRRFTLKFETMKYFVSAEETRTNALINSVGAGAVAGSPGTLPTGWSVATTTGLSFSVVGSGNDENGEPYVDVRLSGTNSSGSAAAPGWQFSTGAASHPVAASGQTWTASAGIKLLSGSAVGTMWITELTTAGTYVAQGAAISSPVTSSQQRFSYTRTLSGGGTVGRAQPSFRVSVASGASIDVTFRITLPQFEQGASASSAIWTTTAPVTRTQGAINNFARPQINMAALEKFYQDHKLHKTFIYPHPVYGNVQVKFYSPLKIPEGIVGGNGALKDFSVELIEIIQ